MVAWISGWAQGIVVAIIVATIIEMILPKGNNKKYIKTVIGVYILFVIISPVITAVSGKEFDFSNIDYNSYVNTQISQVSANTITQTNHNHVEKIYITGLKQEIEKDLKERGFLVSHIEVQADLENEKDYGKIKLVSLKASKIDKEEKEEENVVKTVNTIEIGKVKQESTTSKEETKPLSSKEENEIKQYLVDTYQIEKKQIILQK